MVDILTWSTSSASNTDVDGTNIGEGCDPGNLNNADRKIMANVAALIAAIGGAKVTTGSSNAYALTSGLSWASYGQGVLLAFEANHTNTGAATLNVDAIGSRDIKRVDGTALAAGDITSGGIYFVAYEGTADDFLLLNPTPPSSPALLNTEDQTLTGGARVTVKDLGNLSGQTITPDPGDRPIQKITNNGAGTIAPGLNVGAYLLEVINTTGAGAVTVSGWTKSDGGDAFDTTTTSKFLCHCVVTGNFSVMTILKVA